MERIRARDGASLVLHSIGTGPGIVVVHGGAVTIDIYHRLATALADRFTVHLYNQRGRADAPPRVLPYRVEDQIDDLTAVLEHTAARNVLGHSGGGFIALRTALRLPIDRLALYDPVIPVDGLLPTGWVDGARAAARAGDLAQALALTGNGLNTHSMATKLPIGIQVAICRLFLRTPIGRTMGQLLPMTLDEVDHYRSHDGPAEQWAAVTANVLLASGADGPPYYTQINQALNRALPRAETIQIQRSGHDAINRARRRLVEPLLAFFTGTTASEPKGHR